MELNEASICSETHVWNPDEGMKIPAASTATDPGGFTFSVVEFPGGNVGGESDRGIQLMPSEGNTNYINVAVESPPNDDVFHPNGTLKIVGYDTPLECHSTSEIPITTPKKIRKSSTARPAQHQQQGSSSAEFQNDLDPLTSPIYVKLHEDKNTQSIRKRSSKIPQALPLQKVSRRKSSDEGKAVDSGEEDEDEVVVWMNGVLTNVGKPSASASSGKIYSTAQNCPITVKWLLENFESMVGQSLPRSFVYDQYVSHCGLNKIDSVNAASFGKLIRSVFLGLRTRRLGTRGNSKYHYYGIKIKETSHLLPILNSIRAEQDLLNDTVNGRIRKRVRRTQSVYTGKHVKGLVVDKKIEVQENLGSMEYCYPGISIRKELPLLEGLDATTLDLFEDTYKRHCLKLVMFIHDFRLIDALAEIANFWRLSLTLKRKGLEDYSLTFSKPLLFKIVSLDFVVDFLVRMDLNMFQHIINILISSVLRPVPLQMLQALDNMIQDVMCLLPTAMKGYPRAVAYGKMQTLTAFVRIWKQYSKMGQLSEFIEMTLENECNVSIMRQVISSIDMENICDRAAMIVESATMSYKRILKMMRSFTKALGKDQSLDLWCSWAHAEITSVVSSSEDASVERVEFITADLHSSWLIVSNLIVCTIREMFGADSSLFVPLLQWCGELMQYFRERLLDSLMKVIPVTRFYIALKNEDMSISFMDKHKAKPKSVTDYQQPEPDPMPLFTPTSVRLASGK